MDSSFNPKSKHGIMDGERDLHSLPSSSSPSDVSSSSISSSLSDFMEDSSSVSSSPSSSDQLPSGPLYDMSSLMQQLPFKRGLSRHFQGKSQSFTSLSNVRCLEDLPKPDKSFCKKKLIKSCKSYGKLSENHKASLPKTFSKTISKKTSRGYCSSLGANRSHTLFYKKPPIPPRKSSCLHNQTSLFA